MTMTYPSDSIVLISLVEARPTGDVGHEYWIVSSPLTRWQVTRQEALDFIKDHGLVCTLKTKDGKVYDTADSRKSGRQSRLSSPLFRRTCQLSGRHRKAGCWLSLI